MQILGLLGMYFDAVVVEVKTFLLLFDWLWPYCVWTYKHAGPSQGLKIRGGLDYCGGHNLPPWLR